MGARDTRSLGCSRRVEVRMNERKTVFEELADDIVDRIIEHVHYDECSFDRAHAKQQVLAALAQRPSHLSLTDKFIEDALRSAELIHSDDFVDCHYQDVVTAIMTALDQQAKRDMPTEAMVLEALADLNYDDLGRVGDVVPRESMPAIANAIMALFQRDPIT